MYSKNQIYNLGFNIGHLSYNYLYTNLKGFNGMESDGEIKGEGNSYTTHFRQLDVRIGRWLSIDPKFIASESPYVSMANNPIMFIDVLGDTIKFVNEATR